MDHSIFVFEGGPKVTYGLCDHCEAVPISSQEKKLPWSYVVFSEDGEADISVLGSLCLVNVEEYFIKYHLPNIRQLLRQLGFKGGGPCASSCAELMESVMGLDQRRQAEIHNYRHQVSRVFLPVQLLGSLCFPSLSG